MNRDDRIRTCDPMLPKHMRYQAALHPVKDKIFFLKVKIKKVLTTKLKIFFNMNKTRFVLIKLLFFKKC